MAMGPIPIRMEVAFIQSSTRGPLPRRWALEGDGLHAIDGAIRHINPGAVPKARFSECLYRVNGRNFFMNMTQKRKSDTWNRLSWRTYWTFTKYLFWLIITENSWKFHQNGNIFGWEHHFPYEKLRYIAINPSCHFISPFVYLPICSFVGQKKEMNPFHTLWSLRF